MFRVVDDGIELEADPRHVELTIRDLKFEEARASTVPGSKDSGERRNDNDDDGGQDKVDKVRADMDDVKNVMVDNIEKVLKRGEKIELLVDKTDNLNQQSIRFKKHSTQLKQAMWWQNARLMIFVGVVVVVVVGGIAFSMKK